MRLNLRALETLLIMFMIAIVLAGVAFYLQVQQSSYYVQQSYKQIVANHQSGLVTRALIQSNRVAILKLEAEVNYLICIQRYTPKCGTLP